jgi:hypothetical protein
MFFFLSKSSEPNLRPSKVAIILSINDVLSAYFFLKKINEQHVVHLFLTAEK